MNVIYSVSKVVLTFHILLVEILILVTMMVTRYTVLLRGLITYWGNNNNDQKGVIFMFYNSMVRK